MSRSRASAFFAALVTILAMTAGAVTLAPTAASATRETHYPPKPPTLWVNHGSVKQNSSVRCTGSRYGNREKVYVTITYPSQGHRRPIVRTTAVNVGRSGTFTLNLRLTEVGRAVIRAKGSKSSRSASAVVIVTSKRGHNRDFRRMAFVAGPNTTGSTGLTPASAGSPSDRGLVIAGLGVLALVGAAGIAQATRRRRKAHAA